MSDRTPESVLRDVAGLLRQRGKRFALVGGLAVSVRAEPRFTRDVDLAIVADRDAEVERLVFDLRGAGYVSVALVEHTERKRLATVRMASASGVVVDLLAASSGIEHEIVERATSMPFPEVGDILVARPEELLAMKVLMPYPLAVFAPIPRFARPSVSNRYRLPVGLRRARRLDLRTEEVVDGGFVPPARAGLLVSIDDRVGAQRSFEAGRRDDRGTLSVSRRVAHECSNDHLCLPRTVAECLRSSTIANAGRAGSSLHATRPSPNNVLFPM
jgi:hypothetical protein